ANPGARRLHPGHHGRPRRGGWPGGFGRGLRLLWWPLRRRLRSPAPRRPRRPGLRGRGSTLSRARALWGRPRHLHRHPHRGGHRPRPLPRHRRGPRQELHPGRPRRPRALVLRGRPRRPRRQEGSGLCPQVFFGRAHDRHLLCEAARALGGRRPAPRGGRSGPLQGNSRGPRPHPPGRLAAAPGLGGGARYLGRPLAGGRRGPSPHLRPRAGRGGPPRSELVGPPV
ncbi:MAG: tRNA threonylcarbamoyladenosine biosynthesis protein TsaB, partial [uncultured Rubrobacteraceae bacterium]